MITWDKATILDVVEEIRRIGKDPALESICRIIEETLTEYPDPSRALASCLILMPLLASFIARPHERRAIAKLIMKVDTGFGKNFFGDIRQHIKMMLLHDN
jgi:hypothetical protein